MMVEVVDIENFYDLKQEVKDLNTNFTDLDKEFEARVNDRVAEIFRELSATMLAWPMLILEEHLNNAAKNLEEENDA